MKDAVLRFILTNAVMLPHSAADNYRPVDPGTYTHRQLPLGPMREGITDGVVCYMRTEDRVLYVHLDNMDFVPDPVETHYVGTPKKTRKDRPCLDPLVGETVWDSEGTRIVIGTPRLRDICRQLIANGETLRYTKPAKRAEQ